MEISVFFLCDNQCWNVNEREFLSVRYQNKGERHFSCGWPFRIGIIERNVLQLTPYVTLLFAGQFRRAIGNKLC